MDLKSKLGVFFMPHNFDYNFNKSRSLERIVNNLKSTLTHF
jgi:hypothetical protein